MSDKNEDGSTQMNEEDMRYWVRSYVWGGEYNADEIPLLIADKLLEGEELDRALLEELIHKEFQAKRKAEKTWPKVTDYDQLVQAFEILDGQGILAVHNAGVSLAYSLDDVDSAYEAKGGKDSTYTGYCFYSEEDVQDAIDSSGYMFLSFGHFWERT